MHTAQKWGGFDTHAAPAVAAHRLAPTTRGEKL